jgi:hypothetical protein
MAKRKKRAKLRRRSSASRGRARKVLKSARRGGTKRTATTAKLQRAVKKVTRKRRQPSPSHEIETVVVDVIEQPAPGVITITEFEETQVPPRDWLETKGARED